MGVGIFDVVLAEGAGVPGLWPLEPDNVLPVAERRGRIERSFRVATLADLAELPIVVDPHTPQHAWTRTLALAEQHRLTLYDAAYLELAQRLGAPLATFDGALAAAASAAGVGVIGAGR